MRTLLATISLLLFYVHVHSQCDPACGPNLVPNGDFEAFDQDICDNLILQELYSDVSPVNNWIGASTSFGAFFQYTPDYFNPLCSAAYPAVGVGGSAAIAFLSVIPGAAGSEWFQTQLNEPLVAGQSYCISFQAFGPAELGPPTDGLDVAILPNAIDQSAAGDGENPLTFTPAYSNPPGEFIPTEFTQYTFSYCAEGGEQWIAFGNQNPDETTISDPDAQGWVIVDDVVLSESCNQGAVDFEITASELTIGCNDCSALQAVDDNGTVVNVVWSDGLGVGVSAVDVCPDVTSTYAATFTSETCDGEEIELTQEITIEVDCDIPVVTLDGGSICPGESFTLEAEVSGGTPDYTFQWEPEELGNSEGPFTVSPSETTIYEVVVTDANGEVAVAEATVEVVEEALSLTLPEEFSLCDGPVTIDATTAGAVDYLWSDGSMNPSLTVNQPGNYSVEVIGICETVTAETTVNECDGLSVSLNDQTICAGESVFLEATVSGGLPPYSYSWSPGVSAGNTLEVSPDVTTDYTVNVTDSNFDIVEATASVVVVSVNVDVDLGPDRLICPGETLSIGADLGMDFQYSWNVGSAQPVLEITDGGLYAVRITTPCSVLRDTVQITEALPDLDYDTEVKACEGDIVEIGPPESADYTLVWSDGEMVDRKSVDTSGLYTAELNVEECSVIVPIGVDVQLLNCDCKVYVPNAFTPNADGVNDVFKVVSYCDIETYSLRIFSRWGEEVFSSTEPEEVWNGDIDGGEFYGLNSVYTYVITIQPRNEIYVSEPIILSGRITLLR